MIFPHTPSWSHDHKQGRGVVFVFVGYFFEGESRRLHPHAYFRLLVEVQQTLHQLGGYWHRNHCRADLNSNRLNAHYPRNRFRHWMIIASVLQVGGLWRVEAPHQFFTDCGLITSVTRPVPYFVVHLPRGFLTQTTSLFSYIPLVTSGSGSRLFSTPFIRTWYLCSASAGAVQGETSSFGVTLCQ